MDQYYYFCSSFTKKLIAITMLLIVNLAVTVSGESGCSLDGPVSSGACKDDYANCVTNVITELRDRTPYMAHQTFSMYYPADATSGIVEGGAFCAEGSGFSDCKSCMFAAKDWLDQNCPSSAVGAYDEGICAMTYSQQFH
ncbi:hypothetical protein LINPERPRIM_LOCUS23458 [Linum perenne]